MVRYQGGHNAGHTVVVDGEKYALQLVPSGMLYDHVIPVIANGVVVDLPTLFNEIDTLESRGISCAELKVSSRAHLIFPWHQAHDAIAEAMRGDDKIGTTLKGIGPAYADKARRVGVRVGEVVDPDRFASLVRERAIAENTLIEQAGGEPLDVDEIVDRFGDFGARLAPYVADTVDAAARCARRGAHVLLEGRPGDVPRPRPRHLSVRHVVEPDRRRCVRRHRPRAPRHRPHRRDHQGVHDSGRCRAVPDRAARRRRRHAHRRRPGVRHGHRAPSPGRLARLRDAAPGGAAQQPHRAGAHQARHPRRFRRRSRSAPATDSTAS